jgi:4-hydroxyphenylpyruvate dioxygenase
MSLGRAWVHDLPTKLDQAAANNLSGIEVFFEDLEYLARSQSKLSAKSSTSPEAQLHAAHTTCQLCDDRNLTIIGLQPLMHYEGSLIGTNMLSA